MKKFLLTLIISNVSSACVCYAQHTGTSHAQLKKAAWLLGDWQNKTPRGITVESWKKLNDSTYLAKSYQLRGLDTVSSEHVQLEEHHGNLYYIPTVKNQNDGKPVIFKMTASSADSFIFENPEHDFPQKITYNRISKDSVAAEISGTYKGKQRAIKFPMGRVK